jgi:tetratricopeptide (TPR) repeat protein
LFEKYLAARPETPVVLNNLAYLHAVHLGDANRGLELALRARALDGDSAEIADTLGWIHYGRKEYAEAAALFQESVTKAPANGEFQYHLGLANQQLGRHEVARAAFERAARSRGSFPGKDQIAKRLAELPALPSAGPTDQPGSPKTK